jgi:NAD(P)-dependent dehydrogenase (short-subunit alcohol dehydrogenase family)
MTQDKKNNVWFVTGASKGLGLTLVKTLLLEGYRVAATSRNSKMLTTEIENQNERFLPLELDITNSQSVEEAVSKTMKHFGEINVVVNNAGYGQIGTLEELSDEEAKENFDVNVFGLLNVIRSVMPKFRKQKSGHFFNITSIGGFTGNYAGWGIYCATKFAVSGLTEALEAEGKQFGIKTTLVYPGYFKTNFLSNSSIKTPKSPIMDYTSARQSESFHQNEMDGNQQGDPQKAVNVMIGMSKEDNPALHLFLGQDAYDGAYIKIEAVKADLEKWKSETLSTSFD